VSLGEFALETQENGFLDAIVYLCLNEEAVL
jgi:hypothetical protein